MSDKIFVGNGKEFGQYGGINLNICLSDIPDQYITHDKNGKGWVKLTLSKKRNPDDRGTHYITVNTFKPKSTAQPELPQREPTPEEHAKYRGFSPADDDLPTNANPADLPF